MKWSVSDVVLGFQIQSTEDAMQWAVETISTVLMNQRVTKLRAYGLKRIRQLCGRKGYMGKI